MRSHGREDVRIARATAAATMVFKVGPRTGGSDRADRLAAVARDLGLSGIAHLRQVHGIDAVRIDRAAPGVVEAGEGDILITDQPRFGLAIWTADCVPVLISGPGVIAAVHAGWRGAAAGVLSKAVEALAVDPGRLTVAIGPAIGPCHYPVGDDVRSALAATGADPAAWNRPPAVDLRGFARAQLRTLGVADSAVHTVGRCTACEPAAASFRRDGERAGRQLAVVARNAP